MERTRSPRPSAQRPKAERSGRPSPFGTTTTKDGGELTDLGCPDCPGVLAVHRKEKQMSFACSVGHAFSPESLVEAKEEQLEATLWSGVELYLELVVIHRELAQQARAQGVEAVAQAREDRAHRADELAERLREAIAMDAVAAQDGHRG